MFGILVFACVPIIVCVLRLLSKACGEKRFVVEANKIAWPLWLLGWCVYACEIFHVSVLSRIDGATACLCLYSRAELALWRCSRIEWWAFVNLCENRGLTYSICPGRACGILDTAYVVSATSLQIRKSQPVEYYRSNCESNCNVMNELYALRVASRTLRTFDVSSVFNVNDVNGRRKQNIVDSHQKRRRKEIAFDNNVINFHKDTTLLLNTSLNRPMETSMQ